MVELFWIAVILGLVVLSRRPTRLGRLLQRIGRALAWVGIGLSVVIAAVFVAFFISEATMTARLAALVLAGLGAVAWRQRRRAEERSPERVAGIDRVAFVTAYAIYAGLAVVWLVLGLVPALAAAFPSVADQLREWGTQDTFFGNMALQAAQHARNSSSDGQVVLDYAFSIINVSLATFLVLKVRGNRTANLLAIGMVGTAVAFNLQSHMALLVIGDQLGGFTKLWHDVGVHVLAGIAYVFALLLFPDGAIDRTRGPHLMGLAAFFGLVSFVAIEDHTSALVLLFGVLVPAAAIVAQSGRFRDAQNPELKQLFRLLRAAMVLSLVGAVTVLTATSVLKERDERFTETTEDYEFTAPAAGTYVFFCDPHIPEMQGTVVVTEPDSSSDDVQTVSIRARGNKFDTNRLELVADRTAVIRFTNNDGTKHNVSIYSDFNRRDPVYVGHLFSGQELATFTFRVFRFVFTIIPIALFIAILRFHLWDVDRLVNKAMVYGALTGVLALVYALGVGVAALVPGALFDQGGLVVVWVLAAAFLFRPLRRRLQTLIDRRFYREKLDTVRTLETFAAHVRDQVDLDQLAEELVSVVSTTMHPTQVSLWIRDGESTPVAPSDVGSES